jgi:hypothetical protein
MKFWIDDKRDAPNSNWVTIRNYTDALTLLKLVNGSYIIELSVDHDLGGEKTGYDLINWIEKEVHNNIAYVAPFSIKCHSSNPAGAKNIESAIISIYNQMAKRYK